MTIGVSLTVSPATVVLLALRQLVDEVVQTGGIILGGLVLAWLVDRSSLGRWASGTAAAGLWVAWWAALSRFTFEPDAITTAGWFATAMVMMSVGRRLQPVRLAGLALAGLSYLKLFLHDLAAVEPGIRIVLFLVVGAALVLFAYRSGPLAGPNEAPAVAPGDPVRESEREGTGEDGLAV